MLRRRLLLPLATLALAAGCAPVEIPVNRTFPLSVRLPATGERCIDRTEDLDLGDIQELQQYRQYLKAVRVDGAEVRLEAQPEGSENRATQASGSASVGAWGTDEAVLLARYEKVSLTGTAPLSFTLTDAGNARLSELVVQDGRLRVHVQGCVDALPAVLTGEVSVHAVVTAGL